MSDHSIRSLKELYNSVRNCIIAIRNLSILKILVMSIEIDIYTTL
jgi:hypothetical protein